MTKYIWLDCDPGLDDATAILLATHSPNVALLGVSTVYGTSSVENTRNNAARCLYAFAAKENVNVYPGAKKPLIRAARNDPSIHGADGLAGVQGLPAVDDPNVQARVQGNGTQLRALEGLAKAISTTYKGGNGNKVTVASIGPMTNIALFVSAYPDLLGGIEELVFVGGGVGLGNRGPSAEFNILSDPEAAQIVLDAPVKKTMIPINVTYTAIVTRPVLNQILAPGSAAARADGPLPRAITPLRNLLGTLIGFFADSYKSTFGFVDGPPLHDALTIAYVAKPELFTSKRYRVDVELAGAHSTGETVVDTFNYRSVGDSWGRDGKNCNVAEKLDVAGFFELFLDSVARCDKVAPLNN